MKPASSLFAKILAWFFLNMVLIVVVLALFFTFQSHVNLHAVFGQEGVNRLRTAGKLIAHDLSRIPPAKWSDELARHAAIHQVDFLVELEDGSVFSSTDEELPESVRKRVRVFFRDTAPRGHFPPPPHRQDKLRQLPQNRKIKKKPPPKKPIILPESNGDKTHFVMRTKKPNRYWSGLLMPPLHPDPRHPPAGAMLLAVSDTITGNGFFFDPLPWMVVAMVVMLISVLFWIPMVRSITRPLGSITHATEEIAKGRFDIPINERRNDEIGRLAIAIRHMSARLSAFVKGQKRFMGDVAHELGSPIARIQFGLGALEQRTGKENRQRVGDVMEDVDHLSRLVNELLAFSRADLKADTVTLKKIDLLPVVETAVKREAAPATRIDIDIDPGIRVVGTEELLIRAIANLVRNAVKYAGDAGPITITAARKTSQVEIQVRDMGPGVPEDLVDQLFEPFFRPETSRDRESGGVGLGLAIVKTCVETCKGSVTAANLKPSGFEVKITLNS